MTIIKEFRIVMPLTLDEYQIGQLYAVIEKSLSETGGGSGVEWHTNRPYKDYPLFGGLYTEGQFTRKTYHMKDKVPEWLRAMFSEKTLTAEAKEYNAFPYCRADIKPGLTPEKFKIYIESMHLPDCGETENALNLPPNLLDKRQVIHIDIVNDPISEKDYKTNEDPKKFKSAKGRGLFQGNDWKKTCDPVMCCYKVVFAECNWFMVGDRIENYIAKQYLRMFKQTIL